MKTRTKVICTIGPAVNSYEKIIQLIDAGMNVARLNFSHGTHAEHLVVIERLKKARQELKRPLAIMLDTKGPEIRLGQLKNDQVTLEKGQRWHLTQEKIEGNEKSASIHPAHILDKLAVGTTILFDDGYLTSTVVEKSSTGLVVELSNGGIIRSGKGVNIPNTNLDLPAMTDQDTADLLFGCEQEIDMVAASFIRSAEHVLEIKKLLNSRQCSDILVIAKIENSEGVHNFDTILQIADGIMIARGDLGVELPLSQVPVLQKMMIRKCYLAGKPSITATQMLESMIQNPRPTRAEASDVANAIYDSTSAVMLSGETAVGKYPLEALKVMEDIIQAAEADFNCRNFFEHHTGLVYHDVPSAVSLATVKAAHTSNAQAIFAFTSGGTTARLLSRLRPAVPVIAMTPREKCFHQMSINWGVHPVLSHEYKSLQNAFAQLTSYSLDNNLLHYGDLVVMTAGSPFGISGTTNMMIIENIGDVLVRGLVSPGPTTYGKITLVLSTEAIMPHQARDRIIVIGQCDDTYLPFIHECAGIILQNSVDDISSEKYLLECMKNSQIPLLLRADGAFRVLKEGQLVTLDPGKGLVYNRILPN